MSKNGLLDMLYEPVSPVVHAGQYIAALLLHEPPRLQLLFHTRGCANFQEWSSKHPGAMRILRRCLLVSAASIHTRLVQPLKKTVASDTTGRQQVASTHASADRGRLRRRRAVLFAPFCPQLAEAGHHRQHVADRGAVARHPVAVRETPSHADLRRGVSTSPVQRQTPRAWSEPARPLYGQGHLGRKPSAARRCAVPAPAGWPTNGAGSNAQAAAAEASGGRVLSCCAEACIQCHPVVPLGPLTGPAKEPSPSGGRGGCGNQ